MTEHSYHTHLRPLSRDEVRSLDVRAAKELELPTLILMENAGRGAAEILRRRSEPNARVLIVCGPGNNGGDGGVIARHLDAWGHSIRIVWIVRSGQLRGDAAAQWAILSKSGVDQTAWLDAAQSDPQVAAAQEMWDRHTEYREPVPVSLGQVQFSSPLPDPDRFEALLAEADWLIDGLFGTGLSRPVEGMMRTVIEAMNRSGKPILALDLPSGLDCDTGQPLGATIQATATASFVAPKLGFAQPGAAFYTGEVEVVDIGLPRCLISPFSVAKSTSSREA